MTALSGFATSFAMLATARIGVGIGEASASPAAYSMISDYFPKEKRATALSIYSAGLYIGGGLSLPIGGLVSSRWNAAFPIAADAPLGLVGWQAAFLAVGIPGLLLALWVLTLREPQRGALGPAAAAGRAAQCLAQFRRRADGDPAAAHLVQRRANSRRARRQPDRPGGGRRRRRRRCTWLTGDGPQWLAYGLGVYAVFSWVQSLKAARSAGLSADLGQSRWWSCSPSPSAASRS